MSEDVQTTIWWRVLLPFAVTFALAAMPAPQGLAQHAWYFFSLFSGVVAALVVEPIAVTAVGVIAITLTAVLSKWVLFGPEEQAKEGFKLAGESVKWAFSGFANPTVWLVGGAFMFALGYDKTGLGRRIALHLVRLLGRNSLLLGYAVTFADTLLAPFTPSNTARSAGTMFPVVVNLPGIYGSKPHDPSSRLIGGYIMWTTFAASCITSTLFMTACAPNFLALTFIRKIAHVEISYAQWFFGAAPFAIPLLLALPLLAYWIFPPTIKASPEVPVWAAEELRKMGGISRREITLAVLVIGAIFLWIFADELMDAAIVAFLVISLMLVLKVITWDQMARNHAAWTTLVLLATLVAMADGLGRTGFIKWFAAMVGSHVAGFPPVTMVAILVAVYFFSHYFFSSLTAHTTALLPIMLSVGIAIPGIPPEKLALLLALTTGIMGVVSPYATGAALPYYNSGFLTSAQFWRNNVIFGVIFLAAELVIGLPVLMMG
ncbi:MAG TPA: DASS family sodium-coupled anion symporter [Rhodospirillaceae bacterium]|nr:DASS family sodium-coupled anion symporter [Rhodospirillaceae bacterium]